MSKPFTVTHPLGRLPTFEELQALANESEVQINGNCQAGDFSHSKATGKYTLSKDGSINGDFNGQLLGNIAGVFALVTGRAEVTITERPFFLPEGVLRSNLVEGLKLFCAKFPPET